MRIFSILYFAFTSLLFTAPSSAQSLKPEEIPEPLRPWVAWVLHDQTNIACPFFYNQAEQRLCAWPDKLELNLTETQGQFSQNWQVYAESWIRLPGDTRHWPQDLTTNGQPLVISEREGFPFAKLTPGQHRLAGKFYWAALPESIFLSPDTGLIRLSVNNAVIHSPTLQNEGQLWLKDRQGKKSKALASNEDKLEIQVFRRILDDVPLQVVTRMSLDVSGEQREVVLPNPLLGTAIPLQLNSPLPARLEPDGKLRVQLRPGQWVVELTSRAPENLTEIALKPTSEPWPQTEVWVFEAQTRIRLVEVTGLSSIDPRQTNLPQEWQQLPAYLVKANDKMTLNVIRRGDPDPAPDQLSLERDLWLDFSGQGYSVKDYLFGSVTKSSRLEAAQPLSLGRVVVNEEPQFITRVANRNLNGVEVRNGQINLLADSRFEGSLRTLPVAGWDTSLQNVTTRLHLPPGWRVLTAVGVDEANTTWFGYWTLLDFFMVMIATVAAYKLWNTSAAVLTLITLTVIWHHPEAPKTIWLHLLASVALLKVLPAGRLQQWVQSYRGLCLGILAIIVVMFTVDQIRTALYPQLESHQNYFSVEPTQAINAGTAEPEVALDSAGSDQAVPEPMVQAPQEALSYDTQAPASPRSVAPPVAKKSLPNKALSKNVQARQQLSQDPAANLQTGPGLPTWQWHTVNFSWKGPVLSDQQLRLILLPPFLTACLNLLSVVLVASLAFLMSGYQLPNIASLRKSLPFVMVMILIGLFSVNQPVLADLPSPQLLKELKNRLLKAPECLPQCAQIPKLSVEINGEYLILKFPTHTHDETAIPLPLQANQWMPEQVLVDDKPASGVARLANGEVWMPLNSGVHQITIKGTAPVQQSIQLPLPLKPHQVEFTGAGWSIQGIDANGLPDNQLQLTRQTVSQIKNQTLEPSELPAFVQVERQLNLGIEWQVNTTITRVSPIGSPIVLEIPLLAGESVVTEGLRVKDGKAIVNLAAQETNLVWQSTLKQGTKIKLIAPKTSAWGEIWRLDLSPMWHLQSTDLPVVHYQDPNADRWLPEWRPWPGDALHLQINKPQGTEGQTLTIDNTYLQLNPGKRATDTQLDLSLRSSQGGQHALQLPENAELQSVTINGIAQPIRQEGRKVTLPLIPGIQQVQLMWREARGMTSLFRSAPVNLGIASVNSKITTTISPDRWILFLGGPRLGPAVLFWGVILTIMLLAYALGRYTATPLTSLDWLLLGIGLVPTTVTAGFIIVIWLFILHWRAQVRADIKYYLFNTMQIGLVILTFVALSLLFSAIQSGLLGQPDMQIAGYNSTATQLNWYQDRTTAELPSIWVFSVPLIVYRGFMLAWALWLAFAVLRWLKWGWSCFSTQGLWKSAPDKAPSITTTS